MVYVIILLVVALVLSPVLWMMPSPRQKRQMQLRQRAMALGLQVKICDLPQTYRSRVRKEPPEQGVVYRLLWRHPDIDNGNVNDSFHFLCLREEPLTETAAAIDEALSAALQAMDDSVVAVDYSSSGIAVYWRERGSIETVEQIFQQMQSLQQTLSALGSPVLQSY